MVYEARLYRNKHREGDLRHFQVMVEETDLDIGVKREYYSRLLEERVISRVRELRQVLLEYRREHPEFLTSLVPVQPAPGSPKAVLEMCQAAELAGVGPMAAVAGLFAAETGQFLARFSQDIVVENGGDIWIKTSKIRNVAIFAGSSPFTYRIGLEIRPSQTPLGICTSSGTVGHSLSFGRADAALILAPSAVLADAAATAAGNLVQGEGDLERAVDFALGIPGVIGALVILGDKMAVRGDLKLIPLD